MIITKNRDVYVYILSYIYIYIMMYIIMYIHISQYNYNFPRFLPLRMGRPPAATRDASAASDRRDRGGGNDLSA